MVSKPSNVYKSKNLNLMDCNKQQLWRQSLENVLYEISAHLLHNYIHIIFIFKSIIELY